MKANTLLHTHDKLAYGQQVATIWFADLQRRIIKTMEKIEKEFAASRPPTKVFKLRDKINNPMANGQFTKKTWQRKNPDDSPGGGGTMAIMHGAVMEKMGVNISTVDGFFSEDFKHKIPGTNQRGDFWASGISLVAHPANPHVPAIHFNTRLLVTGKWWFGGGIDLNPAIPDDEDTKKFHHDLQTMCDKHDKNFYPAYKKWCDEYFYIKHRKIARGVGGIFFDQLSADESLAHPVMDGHFEKYFAFIKDVGEFFLSYYPALVRKKMHMDFTPAERAQQLIYRGRYAEFNLLYDRGTRFGLETNGNIEAILMSLPPVATWK